jgi:phosphatidate cytidylyltransferase
LNDLSKRLLVALIGIPISIYLIIAGGLLFASVIAIISSITLWEFYKLTEKKNITPHIKFGISFNIILILYEYAIIVNPGHKNFSIIFIVISIFALISLSITLWSKTPNSLINFSVTVAGILYVTFSFSFLILIREFFVYQADGTHFIDNNRSAMLLLCTIFSIWICDSAAYFVGKSIGKHKLFPSVSPKKTWEGAIGGFFGGVLAMIGFANIPFLLGGFPLIHAAIIGAIIGTVGQIGDLAESKLKRDAEVKDSSALLPGHGGALDRFDSIMFVVPAVFIYIYFFL